MTNNIFDKFNKFMEKEFCTEWQTFFKEMEYTQYEKILHQLTQEMTENTVNFEMEDPSMLFVIKFLLKLDCKDIFKEEASSYNIYFCSLKEFELL